MRRTTKRIVDFLPLFHSAKSQNSINFLVVLFLYFLGNSTKGYTTASFCKITAFWGVPNPSTVSSAFTSAAKDSHPREPRPYICDLRARIECEPLSEHSTRSDRVTNIGARFSWVASTLQSKSEPLIAFYGVGVIMKYN